MEIKTDFPFGTYVNQAKISYDKIYFLTFICKFKNQGFNEKSF